EIYSFFAGNEAARTEQLLQVLQGGRDVALISEAGLPGISDPGQRLVAAARARGVPVEVVPGPSASLTALIGSGLRTERFLFVGFPPRAEGDRLALFGSLRHEPGTLLFYESPERVHRTLGDLAAALGPERPACLARELTKLYEEHVTGTLAELHARYAAAPPRGEVTLVVAGTAEQGATAAPSADAAALGDLETEIRRRLAAGQGPKEIATALTLLGGQPRRKLYQLALLLKEHTGS
ncbi:MAG TPA: rRNA small subunit methyltransferase 1, partial [Pseudomonadota bacterium]|nr:rRNA small subunit methyltransferase 1 [Pseudomonadota bacterium]